MTAVVRLRLAAVVVLVAVACTLIASAGVAAPVRAEVPSPPPVTVLPVTELAQAPTPSPQVDAAGFVTFTFISTTAKTVTVTGSWAPPFNDTTLLRRVTSVQWRAVVGPLAPGVYTYRFTVDDYPTADPGNPNVIHVDPSLTAFLVPGASARVLTRQDVPHGQVTALTYHSAVTGSDRNAAVWTPPGYGGSDTRYPTLYLVHGGGGDYLDWVEQGRANTILDNLLAAGRIGPMAVVMADGNVPGAQGPPRQDQFPAELLENLVPAVERAYRVLPGAAQRALAGLSLGGLQTYNTLLTHPGAFRYVGTFSAGYFPPVLDEIRTSGLLSPTLVSAINSQTELFRIDVGNQTDIVYGNTIATRQLFDHYGIRYEFGGSYPLSGHTWQTWQHDLIDFAPRLFR